MKKQFELALIDKLCYRFIASSMSAHIQFSLYYCNFIWYNKNQSSLTHGMTVYKDRNFEWRKLSNEKEKEILIWLAK